ncbi:sperm flagellar protein 2-like isoform X2 [Babylonia areolata]|uniref:sperm flagellar protein 2-like isoform X2 n=1 Tax=Babylonia areolata TaxID=304850 RepID=UPI003FD07B01
MTDILCRWLNDELNISHSVDPATFARDFSSGYLIGEVLHKYQLQNDFDQFSQSRTYESKLNNFSRLEPVFSQLGVAFDMTSAREVMTERHGTATRLLYQLYIILNNRRKQSQGSGSHAMKLDTIEDNRLIEQARRRKAGQKAELSMGDISSRLPLLQNNREDTSFRNRFLECEKRLRDQEQHHLEMMERSRLLQAKQSEMVAKIKSSTIHVPKPPSKSSKFLQERQTARRQRESVETMAAISCFEDKLKMILLPTDDGSDEIDISYILKRDDERADTLNVVKLSSNSEYISKIRKRLQEDAAAREEREKRRRKVIGEQMSAHQAQEEARREEMMVNKLMRQSQHERRIAVQLLHARQEREAIRNNRIAREQQYQERRLCDFEEALDREAELARQEKEERKEELQHEQELHDRIAAERAELRYRRHYDSCYDIVAQVVDFSCKVAEYRQLTENLIPAKLMRDWTAMFVSGYPLYEAVPVDSGEPTPEQILEEERQMLLDEGDFMEYKNMIGEWQPPAEAKEMGGPPRVNPVVGHIIQRLYSIVHPPTPPPPPPEFPPFPIRACVLGKPFSGKTTVVKQLLEDHRVVVMDVDELVSQAVEAHKNNEIMEATQDQGMRETSASERPSGSQEEEGLAESGGTSAEGGGADLAVVTEEGQPRSEKSSANQPRRQESKDSIPVKPSSMQRSRDKTKDPNEPQDETGEESDDLDLDYAPSVRNKLGSKALKFLKKGRPVDDQIVVDILVDAIKHVPEGTGWVIDGYPQNYNQAKVLEKALSGYDANSKENMKQAIKSKSRKSSLVPDSRPTPPPSEPTSGIDVVVLFDIDDEVCIKRACEQPKPTEGEEESKEDSNPPPEGSASATGRGDKGSVSDPANEQDQLQQRLVSFQDSWPKMDKWFTRFGTLKKVDAGDQPGAVFLEVEKIMEDTVARILGKDLESSLPLELTEGAAEKAEDTPEAVTGEAAPEAPKEPSASAGAPDAKVPGPSRSGSAAGSPKRPASRSSSKEGKDSGRVTPKDSAKKSEGRKSSRESSAKDGKKSSKQELSAPEPGVEPEEPAGPRTPQPGDEEWDFVDLDLDQALAYILSGQWDGVETTYVASCKYVFRQVRQEREKIYRYFFQIRKDFLSYLREPDTKQDFVDQWQRDYNAVPNDLRDDPQVRAELHQRVDDLRERLWGVCDDRKDQAERELDTVMTDGWLGDRLGILTNQYITIMQAELDRYQDTVRLLKDYYKGMEGQIPEELQADYGRIPLMELPVDKQESPKEEDNQEAAVIPGTPEMVDTEQPSGDGPGEAGDVKDGDTKVDTDRTTEPTAPQEEEEAPPPIPPIPVVRIKIPLVPRSGDLLELEVTPHPTQSQHHKGKKGKKETKKAERVEVTDQDEPSVVPPRDPDEKFLFDAHLFAVHCIALIMAEEMAIKQAEEDMENEAEQQMQKEKVKGKGKGKGKDKVVIELTEEEKQKKETKEKMRYEHYFTIKEEEAASRSRLELVKVISMAVVQDLKLKADNAFKDMNDWLGARFLREMESIDTMSEVMRAAIEEGLPLKERIVLEQDDFLLDGDLFVLKTPSPLPVPEAMEEATPGEFTVNQIFLLYKELSKVAPAGVMSVKEFVEQLDSLVSTGLGTDQLPLQWIGMSHTQVEELARTVALGTEFVDWRQFLLSLTWPIPTPTQAELLNALQNFRDMDQKDIHFVSREQFDRTDLWFDTLSPYDNTFDRLTSLKRILFDIFADHSGSLSKLDYRNMLLYFSATLNPYEGFLRALSVAAGTHMPRIPKPVPPVITPPALEQTDSAESSEIPVTSELSTEEVQEPKAADPPMMGDKIPMEAVDNVVPLDALYMVFHLGDHCEGESSRYNVAEEKISKGELREAYEALGGSSTTPLTLKTLMIHDIISQAVLACKTYTSLVINPKVVYGDSTTSII